MSKKLAGCILLLAAWTVLASPASAFRQLRIAGAPVTGCVPPFAHRNVQNVSFFHNTAGQGAGKAAALQAAMLVWNAVPGGRNDLFYAGTTTAGFTTDNVNTLLWAANGGCTGSCLALTALVGSAATQVIFESDTVFNPAVAWNTNGSDFDVQAVAARELGHAIGIANTNLTTANPRPTMHPVYFGTAARTLETDDRLAIQCLP